MIDVQILSFISVVDLRFSHSNFCCISLRLPVEFLLILDFIESVGENNMTCTVSMKQLNGFLIYVPKMVRKEKVKFINFLGIPIIEVKSPNTKTVVHYIGDIFLKFQFFLSVSCLFGIK